MADENKTPEEQSVHDEMEELARIFREELGKAREEAEQAEPTLDADSILSDDGIKAEGYAVTTGEKRNIPEEELCECCGERPRGTERNPKSPFCEECAAIMEKYPYDWKGIAALVCTLAVLFVAIGSLLNVIPVFAHTYRGDKALKKNELYTALSYYSKAESYIDTAEFTYDFKNLRRSEAVLLYQFGVDEWVETKFNSAPILGALTLIENYYDVNNIRDKKIADIYESAISARASVLLLNEHADEIGNDYKTIMEKFDSLVGKKIYITDLKNMDATTVFDELNTEFTPSGSEKVIIYDEGWIRFYQYLFAEENGNEADMKAALEKANNVSTDYEIYTAPFLVQEYLDSAEYDKAEAIIKRMGEQNTQSLLYYDLLARLYRYRDKNYSAAKEVCDTGLSKIAESPDSKELLAYAGSTLCIEKALNLIMLKNYEGAYKAADECCSYQNDFYGFATNDARDLCAILAFATGDTENYEKICKEVAQNVEYYGEEYDFSDDVKNYTENKVTLEELAMSSRYDRRLTD